MISALVTTHDRRALLAEALASVLVQTRPPDEIVVVDDGSTDGTAEELARTAAGAKVPFRVLRHERPRGVSAARNAGIRAASSEWVAFLDSDDLWQPEKLAAQERYHRERPEVPLSYTDEIWIRDGIRVNPCARHRKFGGRIFRRCLPLCLISASSAMVRRDLLLGGVGLFDERLPVCEDYDLWLRLTLRYPVGFLPVPLLVKRNDLSREQLSRKYWGMDRFRVRALRNLLSDPALAGEDRIAAAAQLAEKCRVLALGARKRGRRQVVAYFEALAVSCSPP